MLSRNVERFLNEPQLLSRNVERFRGGLVFKAHRLLYHLTLGSRVIKKKRRYPWRVGGVTLRMAERKAVVV